MRSLLFIFLFAAPSILLSQAMWDYNWMIGTQNGSPEGDGSLISFNNGEVSITYVQKEMNMHVDNGTMSDENGDLLFYTNGCYVADRTNEMMENGGGLNPGKIHNEFCGFGYPVRQGVLILPSPGAVNKYFIIHSSVPNASFSDVLYYSTMDMTMNNGLGKVIEKNEVILSDSLWQGCLTAIRHSNNQDWWVLVRAFWPGQYYKILLDEGGVSVNDFQEFNLGLTHGGWGVGQAVASPDGTKYVHYNRDEQALLFDFDRSTGELNNPQQLFVDDTIYFGGAAFSADSRFLYISNAIELWQFDTEAADIQASKTLIGEYDGFTSPFQTYFSLMQLAPDCRIYMTTGNGTDRLHVINYPNRKGKNCDFRQHAVILPKDNFNTIPNNPNYRLGTPYPVCDSTIQLITSTVQVRSPGQEVKVWPNPAKGAVHVEQPGLPPGAWTWTLYNQMGQKVVRERVGAGQVQTRVVLDGMAAGLYFWEVRGESGVWDSGKLVVYE